MDWFASHLDHTSATVILKLVSNLYSHIYHVKVGPLSPHTVQPQVVDGGKLQI